jgi:hypothetical protein
VEVVARSEWIFVAVFVPFGSGALWSSAAERSPSTCSWFFRAAVRVKPSPDLEWWRIRLLKKLKMVVMNCATALVVQGGGLQGPLFGDFPAAEGLLPIQGLKRSSGSGSGAPLSRPHRRRGRGPEGVGCNFLYILDLSVSSWF